MLTIFSTSTNLILDMRKSCSECPAIGSYTPSKLLYKKELCKIHKHRRNSIFVWCLKSLSQYKLRFAEVSLNKDQNSTSAVNSENTGMRLLHREFTFE